MRRIRTRTLAGAIVGSALVFGVSAAPAFASGTVTGQFGRITYQQAPTGGAGSGLTITQSGDTITFTAVFDTLTAAGPACNAVDSDTVDCKAKFQGQPIRRINANMDDGNDAVSVTLTQHTIVGVFGQAGDDTIVGGDEPDVFNGGAGKDNMDGNGGVDSLAGAQDADTLTGGDDEDLLFGGKSADTLEGNGGDDELRGKEGNDDLEGNKGDDELYGNTDKDELHGGGGKDELHGNKGADKLFSTDDTVDSADCGNGTDTAKGDTVDSFHDCETVTKS